MKAKRWQRINSMLEVFKDSNETKLRKQITELEEDKAFAIKLVCLLLSPLPDCKVKLQKLVTKFEQEYVKAALFRAAGAKKKSVCQVTTGKAKPMRPRTPSPTSPADSLAPRQNTQHPQLQVPRNKHHETHCRCSFRPSGRLLIRLGGLMLRKRSWLLLTSKRTIHFARFGLWLVRTAAACPGQSCV